MIRRRGEEDIRPVNSEHEEAPPTKKKRVWNNFGTGRKRKKPDEIEEKRKPKEKTNLAMEHCSDEGVCDNRVEEKEVTIEQEGLLQQINRNHFSTYDVTGIKQNITEIISKVEKISNENVYSCKSTSSGENRKKIKRGEFFSKFGTSLGDGHSGGGSTQTENKAKPSSANKPKQKKRNNFNPCNHKPITNYFKPATKPTSKTKHNGEGGNTGLKSQNL